MRTAWSLLAAALLLAACSKDETVKPSPLPDIKPTVDVQRSWSADTGVGSDEGSAALIPAVTGQTVYTADTAGLVEARARASGKLQWKRKTHEPVSAGPAAAYNMLFLGTREGEVLALSGDDGKTLWRTQLGGEVLATPSANGDAVAVKTSDGRVTLLDRVSGTVRWSYDGGAPTLSLRSASSPILLSDAVLAGLPSGMLVALERTSGQVIWERRIAESNGKSELDRLVDIAGDFVLHDDHVYVATYQGRVVSMDLRNGQFAWQQDVSSYRPLAVGNEAVFVADADGRLLAVRISDGIVLWRNESLLARGLGGVEVYGDWVLVGDFAGWLHVVRQADGVLVGRRKIDGDGLASAPVVDDGTVFALGRGGKLAALRIVARDGAAAAPQPATAATPAPATETGSTP